VAEYKYIRISTKTLPDGTRIPVHEEVPGTFWNQWFRPGVFKIELDSDQPARLPPGTYRLSRD
jgi:hypothetical protein